MAERTQMLRYAKDLARLYRSAKDDRQRLDKIQWRLRTLERACLDLVRCLSPEAVSKRVARAGVNLLGLTTAGVYLSRGEQYLLVARDDNTVHFPPSAQVSRSELEALCGEPDEFLCSPWTELVGGGPAVVIPLLGRRRAVGFLIGEGDLEDLEDGATRETISLLSGSAGVVLENFLLEEKRGRGSVLAGAPLDRDGTGVFHGMVGRSQQMRDVFAMIERLARVDSPVLILGETGTGKSLVARALHETGRRAKGPFVSLNCGAIPESLVESELFGHEVGSFTGAIRQHHGKVELANGGTLFLDEVGELPPQSQVKLLSFLEGGRFCRVGGEEELVSDVRIVSATNRDVEAADSSSFRRDLLFRLNVFTIPLPPLRRRGADVIALARRMARSVAQQYQLPSPNFDERFQEMLLAYPWPGNVRELRNVIEKAVILADQGPLSAEDLPTPDPNLSRPEAAEMGDGTGFVVPAAFDEEYTFAESKSQMIERWEVVYIEDLLSRTGGNIAWAARMARLDKKNLHRKLKRYGIDARAHKRTA